MNAIIQPGGGTAGSCRSVCTGGINPGASCGSTADCRVCMGGSKAGQNCAAAGDCPGGTCPTGGTCSATGRMCAGGPYNGKTCANALDCNGCDPNRICTGVGVPLPCCTGVDAGSCPLAGSCALVQNKITVLNLFPVRVPLNGVCVPRVAPDVGCSTDLECAPTGRVCQLARIDVVVGGVDSTGTRPLRVPRESVLLNPAAVSGIGTVCVSAGADAFGELDCDGGTSGLDFTFARDHNTTVGGAGNTGSAVGLPDDPTCSRTFIQPDGGLSVACIEGTKVCSGGANVAMICTTNADCPSSTCADCTTQPQGVHGTCCNGTGNACQGSVDLCQSSGGKCQRCVGQPATTAVCNSPIDVNVTGTFQAGDSRVAFPLGLTIIGAGAFATAVGPDGLPCTADDTTDPPSTVRVALTTGTTSISVYDVDNRRLCQGGTRSGTPCTLDSECTGGGACKLSKIGPSSRNSCTTSSTCPDGEVCVDPSTSKLCAGSSACTCQVICQTDPLAGSALRPCTALLDGRAKSCSEFDENRSLSGLVFGGGFPAFDTSASDIVTLFQFTVQ